MKTLMLGLFLLCCQNKLLCQQNNIVFDHYGYSEGFYPREAMQTCATSNGMIWITSNDGLARFDSKDFKFYQHIQGDTSSLSDSYCTSLIADKRDWLWLSAGGQLDVFNTANEKITHVAIANAAAKSNTGVLCLSYNCSNDVVWAGTENGLYYTRNGNFQLQKAASIGGNATLGSMPIHSITQEGTNVLWLTSGTKIIKYNTESNKVETVEIPGKVDGISNTKDATILISTYLQKNGTLWLGTNGSGLIEYIPSKKIFHQYVFRNYQKESNAITAITQTSLEDEEDVLWLSTLYIGLQAFNIHTKKFTPYNSNFETDKYSIKRGNTYGLFLQSKKALWIGSANGLHKYDFNKQVFKKIELSSIANGIEMLPIGSIAAEKSTNRNDEKLWIHIPYKGGYIYNKLNKTFEEIPKTVTKYFQPPTNFWDVFIDKNNIAWIATGQYGLIGYDITAQKIILKEKQYFYKEWEWVHDFFEDTNGTIWLQTFNGLFKIDGATHQIMEIKEVNERLVKEGLSLNIAGMDEDENGTIWFVTDFEGENKSCVAGYTPNTKQVTMLFNETTNQEFKNWNFDLRDILCKNGKLLVANFSVGLLIISNPLSKNPSIHLVNKEQGVQDTYMSSLLKDNAGNIWISNGHGISSFNDKRNSFSNYSSAVYSMGSDDEPLLYLSKQSNTLYVGQVNAINYFNTNSLRTKNEAELLFTGIRIFNKEYKTVKTFLANGDKLILAHSQNMISVGFALLSYTNANDNMYSWKLEGLEKEWNTSRANVASYTNLKPGTYTLLVKAANCYGEWTENPIKLIIKIKAPFYNTWWFYVLCLFITAGIIYWAVQLRINRINEKNKLRNKIASDLHDEIGSTLTSINILSNVSQQAMQQQPIQAIQMMQQIAQQSKTVQQNMSDIVWSIRSENERIEDLLVRMREYAAQTLEPLGIATTIKADDSVANKNLPMEYRKDLLLIYKEAINNIAKHANASVVEIYFANIKNGLSLSIQDNGTWKGTNSGTGTKTMKERALQLGGTLTIDATKTGTEVLLTIPTP